MDNKTRVCIAITIAMVITFVGSMMWFLAPLYNYTNTEETTVEISAEYQVKITDLTQIDSQYFATVESENYTNIIEISKKQFKSSPKNSTSKTLNSPLMNLNLSRVPAKPTSRLSVPVWARI